MRAWFEANQELVMLIGGFALYLIFVGMVTVNSIQIWSLKHKYKKLMGDLSQTNLEEVLFNLRNKIALLEKENKEKEAQLALQAEAIKTLKGKLGFIRYNAFGEQGNDLSFSLALLDEQRDGVVISGIYGRDETYVFAKPVRNGTSTYTLTPEEIEAIQRSQTKE